MACEIIPILELMISPLISTLCIGSGRYPFCCTELRFPISLIAPAEARGVVGSNAMVERVDTCALLPARDETAKAGTVTLSSSCARLRFLLIIESSARLLAVSVCFIPLVGETAGVGEASSFSCCARFCSCWPPKIQHACWQIQCMSLHWSACPTHFEI